MIEILPIKNKIVLKSLDSISEYIFNNNDIMKKVENISIERGNLDPTSDEYLYQECFKNPDRDYSFAEFQNVLDLLKSQDDKLHFKINSLKHYLQLNDVSIAALYPKHSTLSWHTNEGSAGAGILFSYSVDGDGCFRYYDNDKNVIVDIKDAKGWQAKIVYYTNPKSIHHSLWHCAKTGNYRLSVGYKIPYYYMNDYIKSLVGENSL
jgi:hypothetical protein